MKSVKKGKLLKIYISENQKYKHEPLFHTIVKKAKNENIIGITVYRGIEGLCVDNRIHSTHILTLCDDLPVVLEIFDTNEKIDKFLNTLETLNIEGLVITQDNIDIIKYSR